MKMSKLLSLAIATVLAVAIFTGCGGDSSASIESDSNTVVICIVEEIEGTDIQQIGWENVVHYLLYEPLVQYNEDLTELEPGFAESYEISEDGMEITFVLPEDSKFSNGDPLTSESVKKSVERFMETSEYSGDLDPIDHIEIIDDRTFKYVLTEPSPFMYASLGSTYGGVVDVDVADEVGADEFNRCVVANGPYMVKEWVAGSHITLERNPYFKTNNPCVSNKGVANPETIIVRFIPDDFTRVNELMSGNVDILLEVPSSYVADFEVDESVDTIYYTQPGVHMFVYQTEEGALADIKVRQAINIGIDRDALAEALNDRVTPYYGFLTDAMTGYSQNKEAEFAQRYAYNPEKAKELLTSAGYTDSDGDGYLDKDGQTLTIEYLSPTDYATDKAAAPVIQAQLQKIGIDLQIREYEKQYIKELQRQNDYQLASGTFVWPDADMLYYMFTEESGYPWHEDDVTEALVKARYTVDDDERIEAYEEAQEKIFNYMSSASLYADVYCSATRNNVKGLIITKDGRIFFHDVVKE